MYQATTRDIRVTVRPQYLPDQSDPAASQFVWAYHVRLENLGGETVSSNRVSGPSHMPIHLGPSGSSNSTFGKLALRNVVSGSHAGSEHTTPAG